eukprot:TRINITY_DN10108_c0_g2_i2.p1 TRINITY_DN10108_c0_g2~~TRINITY_DN10108_c0_g2_i2.p1  ORF type:complete len:245 (-),score=82.25 TRINITY_DN10108_c0_g2_i2:116-850(-)
MEEAMACVSPTVAMEEADRLWAEAERTRQQRDHEAVLDYLQSCGAEGSGEGQWRLARACKDVALHLSDKKEKEKLLLRGLEHAKAGEAMDPENFKLALWKGIMYGQYSDFASIGDKVSGAAEIRDNFKRAIELNPADSEAKHCLGQWMFALADMNWVGRKASQVLGLKGTYEEALELFEASESDEPGRYLKNQYMIALCLKKLKRFAESKEWLDRIVMEPVNSPDDESTMVEANELLQNVIKKM